MKTVLGGRPAAGSVDLGDEGEGMVLDPVCGQPVLLSDDDTVSLRHHGRLFHFCGAACRGRFISLADRIRLEEAAKRGALFEPRARIRWGVA